MLSFIDDGMEQNFSNIKPMEITFCGAQKWFVKMYEKLGWMALGQSNGFKYKPKMYMNKINHLIISIKNKKNNTISLDRQNDLEVILTNSRKLKEFAQTLFSNSIIKDSNIEEGVATKVTMKWLSKWNAMLYSKLGWMALVKSEGKKYKVKCYLRYINDLIASGKMKIGELTDPDSINDAKIIYNNSKKLKHFAEKLLL